MNKQDVINYVVESPQNSNPAVLSTILDDFAASEAKPEIELTATENKVYTPDKGKVYKKVTVNVPIPTPGSECEILEFTVDEVTGYYTSVKTVGEIIADNATTPQGILFEEDFVYRATGMGAQSTIVGGSVYKLNYVKENTSASNYTLCFVTTGLIDHGTSVVDFNETSDSYIVLQPYS